MDSRVDCDHFWRYFVDLKSGSVKVRRCERCGVQGGINTLRDAEKVVTEADSERLTA